MGRAVAVMAISPGDAWSGHAQLPAIDLRERLNELRAERLLAWSHGLTANGAYMGDLDSEIAEVVAAYTGAAVTEIATLRAELFGPQVG
jgi:hypothetical protein